MSNRRQRKLEKKRKKRTLAKKKARVAAAQRPKPDQLLVQAAARSPFGPCSVSADWDNEEAAQLVTVIVTRRLPDDRLVPGIALVDRTCLGIKDGYFLDPMSDVELGELVEELGTPHGGMVTCEPLVAQSVVYHAIDYAQRLGFAPGPDFREALFGPRPAELTATPLHAAARPLFVAGPRDNVKAIMARLEAAVGADGFDFVDAMVDGEPWGDEDEDAGEEEEDDDVIEIEEVNAPR